MAYQCDNCGARWLETELQPIKDYHQRVAPGEIAPAGECPDCGCLCHKAGSEIHEYAFDVALSGSIRVKAGTEEEARAKLYELIDCADTNFGAWPDGSPATGEVTADDASLYEIDGEEYDDRRGGPIFLRQKLVAAAYTGRNREKLDAEAIAFMDRFDTLEKLSLDEFLMAHREKLTEEQRKEGAAILARYSEYGGEDK